MLPYIGITDFDSRASVDRMWEVFKNRRGHLAGYQLHVGVMMSRKTLYGLPSKWSNVWPRKDELPDIFGHPDTYNCLHYADYDGLPGLSDSLADAVGHCGGRLHAVQLDMVWPDHREIKRFHAAHPHLEIILQIGRLAFASVENDPERLIDRLRRYTGATQRLLLDRSGGEGKALNADLIAPHLRMVRTHLPTLGLGVAGGLGPRTISLLDPLLVEFNGLSIDAQGRLRPSGDAKDPVDWDMAAAYLERALEALT